MCQAHVTSELEPLVLDAAMSHIPYMQSPSEKYNPGSLTLSKIQDEDIGVDATAGLPQTVDDKRMMTPKELPNPTPKELSMNGNAQDAAPRQDGAWFGANEPDPVPEAAPMCQLSNPGAANTTDSVPTTPEHNVASSLQEQSPPSPTLSTPPVLIRKRLVLPPIQSPGSPVDREMERTQAHRFTHTVAPSRLPCATCLGLTFWLLGRDSGRNSYKT